MEAEPRWKGEYQPIAGQPQHLPFSPEQLLAVHGADWKLPGEKRWHFFLMTFIWGNTQGMSLFCWQSDVRGGEVTNTFGI